MGLKPAEVKVLTLKDFNLMLTGYHKRQEKEWDRTRHIMAYTLNYAGMGSTEYRRPQDILSLSIDKEDIKKMITSMSMAKELFKEFE